jgi:hypothetical protein
MPTTKKVSKTRKIVATAIVSLGLASLGAGVFAMNSHTQTAAAQVPAAQKEGTTLKGKDVTIEITKTGAKNHQHKVTHGKKNYTQVKEADSRQAGETQALTASRMGISSIKPVQAEIVEETLPPFPDVPGTRSETVTLSPYDSDGHWTHITYTHVVTSGEPDTTITITFSNGRVVTFSMPSSEYTLAILATTLRWADDYAAANTVPEAPRGWRVQQGATLTLAVLPSEFESTPGMPEWFKERGFIPVTGPNSDYLYFQTLTAFEGLFVESHSAAESDIGAAIPDVIREDLAAQVLARSRAVVAEFRAAFPDAEVHWGDAWTWEHGLARVSA